MECHLNWCNSGGVWTTGYRKEWLCRFCTTRQNAYWSFGELKRDVNILFLNFGHRTPMKYSGVAKSRLGRKKWCVILDYEEPLGAPASDKLSLLSIHAVVRWPALPKVIPRWYFSRISLSTRTPRWLKKSNFGDIFLKSLCTWTPRWLRNALVQSSDRRCTSFICDE